MVLCSGEPQGGFCNVGCVHCCFCDVWCCSSFIAVFVILVVVLHSLLFDVKPYPSLSYCRVFRPILYFQPSSLQGNSWQFHFNLSGPFFTVLRERYGFERAFSTHRRFFYAPSPHFCHNLLFSRSPWEAAILS